MKLLLLDFTSVTKLKFTSNSRLHRYLGPFFSQFRSVDVISTDLSTLSHLARLQKKFIKEAKKKATIMFPTLEVIDLSICSSLQSISSVNRLISTFLQFRVREGHPITTFGHVKLLSLPHHARFFMRFLAVKGLQVLYRLSKVEGMSNILMKKSTQGNAVI